ncbi:hypothetical protein RchiOBHm_Chr7g0240191 [Rosa chinensis]|uniref:Uncharacterized protein n=1 Tax=Rosa chinensis TaxID=74649 RepID=A0A2P6PHY8_ROSCH|nr:hypothetical protein RchiOBHm_Chr7g0240191 [Rosa chinensis]
MSTAGYDLAEACVLRDSHRKKVKMEKEKAKSGTPHASESVKSSCCLFRGLKKIHASNSKRTCSAENAEAGS